MLSQTHVLVAAPALLIYYVLVSSSWSTRCIYLLTHHDPGTQNCIAVGLSSFIVFWFQEH